MNALKTLPAALVAALGVIIAQGHDKLPPWLLVVAAAVVAGAAVYATPPGPNIKTPQAPARGQHGIATWGAIALGIIVGGVVLWVLGLLVGRM